MIRRIPRVVPLVLLAASAGVAVVAQPPQPPALRPALALEAEDAAIESGWKVIRNGEGNYNIDVIGFGHIGGERLLHLPARATSGVAVLRGVAPADGLYRLWVRYEYPAFSDPRFRVKVAQAGRTLAEKVMAARDNPRLGFGNPRLVAQHDPSWGPEGLFEEPLDVPGVRAGEVTIAFEGVENPSPDGVAADRNLDLVYMTTDTADFLAADGKPNAASWYFIGGGGPGGSLYPILNAFRDTRGPRYEVAITNRGGGPLTVAAEHGYNRIPWRAAESAPVARDLQPGATAAWTPLMLQDTCHCSLVDFVGGANATFEVQIRPVGGAVEKTLASEAAHVRVYLPAYPGRGEKPVTPQEEIDATLAVLAKTPAPGKMPTVPLAYGGWVASDQPGQYGAKYGALYKAIGMRSIPTTIQTAAVMASMGLPLTKSAQVAGFRNPPTADGVAKARESMTKAGLLGQLRYYDYGDEIHFAEWVQAATGGRTAEIPALWAAWYGRTFPGAKPPADRPNSDAATARSNPRLYVDSLLFYEDLAIDHVAAGHKLVKATLGPDVLAGANYSAHPFYLPEIAMYVHWFRRGAADFGRHSEYFWQVAQAGPMVNGYVAEHFRTGMRFNPRAVHRQYTMPHSPGNTEASFIRTAFSHLAHGARALDYFGIGMNECFTENHIDHRDHDRYRQIRDVNHSMALVEDVLPESTVVPSRAAILLSDSTERWDLAGMATDLAGHAVFGPQFRTTRLHHHLERLGLWKALTFAGASPDLLVEEDLAPRILAGYGLLWLVGDSIPAATAGPLEAWVRGGGTLVATSGVGRFGAYREPNPDLQRLLGIESRTIDEKETFLRPRQELPFIKPTATVKGDGLAFPALSSRERVKPASGTTVEAVFSDDGSPAIVSRTLGKGTVRFIAAYPGIAFLWTALQPPRVPDRGAGTHALPIDFDTGVDALVRKTLAAAGIEPAVVADPPLIDTRLVKGSDRVYFLPLANYNAKVGGDVTFTVRLPGGVRAGTLTSSYRGRIPARQADDRVEFTVPALGYGDMLRIDVP